MKPNRLINATSPYLLQHALNPVDWFEWNEEALTKAQQENKPILVSIGYSSCHWCHVMEKQSFENEDIAALMNEFFVCIKVDREERPDIDQVYMEAVQALGANGGWPLNVFLTPDQKPFFGGTYFSPKAWAQVLININKAYTDKREQVLASAEELRNVLNSNDIERFKQNNSINDLKQEIEQAFQATAPKFDKTWGGIDKAPKFIMPSVWQWMLRYYKITKNEEALAHVNLTLKRILYGGIYDQIGGGFARYSVDREWFAPHFEKMLYDNAQLLSLYAEAYALTKDNEYKRAVQETFDWLEREMKDTEGAYYAALDADSEGEEGKFYVWTDAELKSVLKDNYQVAYNYFECTVDGNWEHGNNILKRKTDSQLDNDLLNKIKSELLTIRDKRSKPGLDGKILGGWNALTIIGLADAYRYLKEEKYLNAAKGVIDFIEKKLLKDNILFRSYKDKISTTEAFLDDYAALIAAYIAMHQVTLDESFLIKAKSLTASVLDKFYDDADGFFYYSSKQDLIARKKEVFDNVISSSNSMMARNLILLGQLFENEKWISIAEQMIKSLAHVLRSELNYTANWGMAAMELYHSRAEVVLSGKNPHEKVSRLQSEFLPFALLIKANESGVLTLAKGKTNEESDLKVYVCFNKTCKLPVNTIEEVLQQIK
jgi:uncharacterized protein YyaL (SSP411 family)